jgi:hypothetical protein
MTHDLRDRIAAVQQAHHLRMDFNHPAYGNCRCGFRTGFQERDGEDDFDLPWWELHAKHVADAVIAALPLHRNDEEDEYGGYKPTGRYRYVTDWMADV